MPGCVARSSCTMSSRAEFQLGTGRLIVVLGILLACEHGTGEPPVQHLEPTTLAEEVLRLELEAQALRPLARALAGRSFGENSIGTLEAHLAVTAAVLLADEGQPDGDARTAAEVGLSAAGLFYDLLRVDLEATARGMSAIPRSNC